MKDLTGQKWSKRFAAHSDIDLQFIADKGAPVTAGLVDEFVKGVNERVGRELLQHGDNFTGLTRWAEGPTKAYQDATTILIGQSGYMGMGPGLTGFLGFLDPTWREAAQTFFRIPGVP